MTINSDIDYSEFENEKSSYLLIYEGALSLSTELRNMFINKELFDKINFSKLKEYNLVYDSRKRNLELNSRYKTDLTMLLLLLRSKKIISFKDNKDMNKIFKECFGKAISETIFTNTQTKINLEEMNQKDSDSFQNANDFIGNYISNCEMYIIH